MNTSGILLEENADGSIRIGYVDYNVEFFGGGDYESFYTLDKENADKLKTYVSRLGFADFLKGLTSVVGERFSDRKFQDCCAVAEAKYEHITWR